MAYGPQVPLYDEEVWTALLETWRQFPSAFTRGCGQLTMVRWVREATGQRYSPRRIRRTLLAACEAGRARGVYNHDSANKCYTLVSRRPLGPPPDLEVVYIELGRWDLVARHAVLDRSGRLCGAVLWRRSGYAADYLARRDLLRLSSQMRGGS